MAESLASIIKLSLPLANEDLGRLIRRIEKHGQFENTLTITFAQEHVQSISLEKLNLQTITVQKVSQVQTSDDTLTKTTQTARRAKRPSTLKLEAPSQKNKTETNIQSEESSTTQQALGMINIANLSEQETADLITIMCPADLAGVKCNQADFSCPRILEKRGCVMFFLSQLNPSHCKFGHDHRAARLFNYEEGSACHGVLDLETNKQRRLNGQGPTDFGLVPRAGTV
ncbi:hypothetical protein BDV30DRAFT_239405 [Aspergillus minisclerotigenes]|uniref:Uncharacterized protein n=1 Tax=Aspergillus minisclerotigenes TaxID=656917 RepID=A0A5N6J2Q6_9EURO|nr:hypothetical protein BDV30DRAFT_239405 [Aspergillus minisclerotigenes]